jgi:import inner membrane translocase subunit TIM22
LLKQEIVMQTAFEACPTKALLSGGAGHSFPFASEPRPTRKYTGFGLGAFFSLMSQSMRYEDPITAPAMGGTSLRAHQKAAEIFREMGRGMWRGGKQWGLLGMLFSGIECCVEGVRGTSLDV